MQPDDIKNLYRRMLRIRKAEEKLQRLFSDGQVPGFLHLSIGQEAVAVGVSHALTEQDTVSSNHRGHGHTLAKGVDLKGFFAETLGKETGICGGRGGSMHVADLSIGMLGANGIVGAGIPITTGSALALKMQGQGHIAVVYFGDGAIAEGVLHECFNIAALWQLPCLFVCENNGWSEFSPADSQIATTPKKLAGAFGITYRQVDGNDVVAVAEQAKKIVAAMRKKPAPVLLECHTTRIRGHYEGDKQTYRDEDELSALSDKDPIKRAAALLIKNGTPDRWLDEVTEETDAEIEAAVADGLNAPEPPVRSLLDFVYTRAEA